MKTKKLREKNGNVFRRIGRVLRILRYIAQVIEWLIDSLGNFPTPSEPLVEEHEDQGSSEGDQERTT